MITCLLVSALLDSGVAHAHAGASAVKCSGIVLEGLNRDADEAPHSSIDAGEEKLPMFQANGTQLSSHCIAAVS